MGRGARSAFGRVVMAGAIAVLGTAPAACGSLLGIDSGTLRGDDASDVDVYSPDVAEMGETGANDAAGGGGGDADPGDAGSQVDSAPITDASTDGACTPDLSWCTTHCGKGLDNCGQMRDCPSDCPTGEQCVSQKCTCTPDPNFCSTSCLSTTDNCGNPVTCPDCAGGLTCTSGACGCVPKTPSQVCGSRQCGQLLNNCNQKVNCGANSTPDCANSTDVCLDAGTCCTPNNANLCQGLCQTSVTNNCGQTIPCPVTCPSGGTCLGTHCCVPNGTCSASCTNNCGQYDPTCCPPPADGGPPPFDSGGPPPVDGGTCAGPSGLCSKGCCPGLLCGQSATCVTYCGTRDTQCSSPNDCCYGLTCSGVATTTSAAITYSPYGLQPVDGGIVVVGTCQ